MKIVDNRLEKRAFVEAGDILDTNCGIRLVIKSCDGFACVDLEDGTQSTAWYDSIEELLDVYSSVSVIKSADVKIVLDK